MGADLPPGAARINGLAVSRALGDQLYKTENTGLIGEPYVSPLFQLQDDDECVILASDGVKKTKQNFFSTSKNFCHNE